MSTARLSLYLENAGMDLPETGAIAVFGPVPPIALNGLPKERLRIVCHVKPDFDQLQAAGYSVGTEAPESAALAIVFLPRAKQQARALVAAALALAGDVIIDGQKSDGIDSLYREMRDRAQVSEAFSKAHGKTFRARAGGDAFADWVQSGVAQENAAGFVTRAGVFSADGIDPASRLLAETLPKVLGAHVADLGAGWGYLGAQILQRESVQRLDLVEADLAALECAQANISDPRAQFHWADATRWIAEGRLDAVVMNPPFHQGRKGLPELGQAFIAAAAKMLAPSGRLWLVANRHLPYEKAVTAHFREAGEIGGDTRFKIIQAARPTRKRQ
nr:methyltransferase [Aquicoccus sp. G2-2]MEA1114264.1 methyltransferase [Aquicoccus sp. G2-2]